MGFKSNDWSVYIIAMCRHKNIKIGGKGDVTKQDTVGVVQLQR